MSEERPAAAPVVPGYAGHADASARRLSDKQVRAWVGEMLAELQARLTDGTHQERFDALLMRCEFGDQHVIRAIEDDRFGEPELAGLVEALDRRLVEAAAGGRSATAEGLGELFDALERAFDERTSSIEKRLNLKR
jgi:hypothetical protein